jgi:BASS family bile acid:Na+ symporter
VGVMLAFGFAPTTALTMGFILLATTPGGLLSNLMTDLARGDLALSVSLSLFTSAVYIFTLPFIAHFGLLAVYGESQSVDVPIWSSMKHILAITAFPIACGMLARRLAEPITEKVRPVLRSVATWTLTIIFGLIVIQEFETIKSSFGIILGMVVAMNLTNFLVALGLSKLGSLQPKERIALVVEHLIRQEATAIYVAVTILGRKDMSLPMIINTFVGMGICVIFVGFMTKKRRQEEAAAGV